MCGCNVISLNATSLTHRWWSLHYVAVARVCWLLVFGLCCVQKSSSHVNPSNFVMITMAINVAHCKKKPNQLQTMQKGRKCEIANNKSCFTWIKYSNCIFVNLEWFRHFNRTIFWWICFCKLLVLPGLKSVHWHGSYFDSCYSKFVVFCSEIDSLF